MLRSFHKCIRATSAVDRGLSSNTTSGKDMASDTLKTDEKQAAKTISPFTISFPYQRVLQSSVTIALHNEVLKSV